MNVSAVTRRLKSLENQRVSWISRLPALGMFLAISERLWRGRMGLNEALAAKREAVLERWFQAVLATYPADTARFLAGGADPFANPVGHTVREGLGRLYDRFAADAPERRAFGRDRRHREDPGGSGVLPLGGRRVRLHPQGDSPRGVGRRRARSAPAQAALDNGVDRLALVAFDVYMQCREKIFEIRVREIKESQLLAARLGCEAYRAISQGPTSGGRANEATECSGSRGDPHGHRARGGEFRRAAVSCSASGSRTWRSRPLSSASPPR